MVKKERKTPLEGLKNAFFVEDYYEDEPITKNAISSIDDFYNFMHLLNNSWSNKKYQLKMENAGYNIYDKNNNLSAWIGIKEKSNSIMFIICSWGKLYKKALKYLDGPMVIYDWDEDLWIFSELQVAEITKEIDVKKQKKIIIDWINKEISKIL